LILPSSLDLVPTRMIGQIEEEGGRERALEQYYSKADDEEDEEQDHHPAYQWISRHRQPSSNRVVQGLTCAR
jgi:hypothetical protein